MWRINVFAGFLLIGATIGTWIAGDFDRGLLLLLLAGLNFLLADRVELRKPRKKGTGTDDVRWPKLVRVERKGQGKTLKLDGVEFPWFFMDDSFNVKAGSRSELTSVTVEIPCDRVEIEEQN